MIYLKLFLTFLEIGAVSFGGGYGMISLIRETVLANGWLTEAQFLNFIAVSESTPGPLAVNMATFIGASQGGILGSLLATLGVVLPSFVIILLIAALLRSLLKYAGVSAFLSGVRPCVVALNKCPPTAPGPAPVPGLLSQCQQVLRGHGLVVPLLRVDARRREDIALAFKLLALQGEHGVGVADDDAGKVPAVAGPTGPQSVRR